MIELETSQFDKFLDNALDYIEFFTDPTSVPSSESVTAITRLMSHLEYVAYITTTCIALKI